MLAAGARAAISQLDKDLDDALIWDFFGRTYGWTEEQVKTQMRAKLPALLLQLGAIRAEVEREASEKE